jgi:hypothetical protein
MSETQVTQPDWPFLHGGNEGLFGTVLMSNFDHQVDLAVAQRLKDEQGIAEYTAWNFHAECWFADGQYHALLCQHGIARATLSANTPEELMTLCCKGFGND